MFNKVFWTRKNKIIAGALASVTVVAAIVIPVAVTQSSSGSGNAAVSTDPSGNGNGSQPVGETEGKQLLILAGGQSNMAGVVLSDPNGINTYSYVDSTPVLYAPYQRDTSVSPPNAVLQLSKPAVKLKSAGDGEGGFSITKGIAFKQAATGKYTKVWLINASVSSSGFRASDPIYSLNPRGQSFQVDAALQAINANAELKEAMSDGNCEVVMTWLQGETDAFEAATDDDADLHTDLVAGYLATIRERLPLPVNTIVPIVVGGMEPSWVAGQGGGAPVANRSRIQNAIKKVPDRLPYSAYADPTGVPTNSREQDYIHYGLSQFGYMADKFIAAINTAKNNSSPAKQPTGNAKGRIFAQFTSAVSSGNTTAEQPASLRWADFTPFNWVSALNLNHEVPVDADKNPLNQNFSNLRKTYAWTSADTDKRKKYRYKIEFYSSIYYVPYLEVQFVQSVNPAFYGTFANTADDYFEIEKVTPMIDDKNQIPGFTKDNIALGPLRAVAANPQVWSASALSRAFTMNVTNSETNVSFPISGNPQKPLGVLKSKDGTLSWNFDHIALVALPG